MIQPKARGIRFANGFAINSDDIVAGHVDRGAFNLRAVHVDTARFDHTFNLTTTGNTSTCKDFGDAVTRWGTCGLGIFLIFCHSPALDYPADLRKPKPACQNTYFGGIWSNGF